MILKENNFYIHNFFHLFKSKEFKGWGHKRTGKFAQWCSQNFNGELTLLEDGFIRSIDLGVNGAPAFSIIEDNIGIYYDATTPSKLENILNTYDFTKDKTLIQTAKKAIGLIKKYHISKYNHAKNISNDYFQNNDKKVLIIAQTHGDKSLEYGMTQAYTTDDIVNIALKENPNATLYIKIHPDVLSGKKESDININTLDKQCKVITDDINPISLLKHFDKVYTKTSQMGFEALFLDKEVICFGMPFYAGWGLTDDRVSCDRRRKKLNLEEVFAAAYILYTKYYNPYTQKESNILDTIETINKYRNIYRKNSGNLYFFGFSRWKQGFTTPFFSTLRHNKIFFCSTLENALTKDLNNSSKIYIWGKKAFNEVEAYAKEQNIPLHRVEDGFIRSVSLGSDLTKAYSLVVDSRGIYFDPTQESDLEHILNTYNFEDSLLQRAEKLQNYLIENKISKYNIYQDKQLELEDLKESQTVVMVPGQVEDDASIIYGANGMTNLELLQQARKNAPDAYIIYKPHPDVLAGNRKGNIPKEEALKYCNTIIEKASIDSVLERADEVHTMTSLVGFEALMRGKKVYTYGSPFYAGWGLTTDAKAPSRRNVEHTLEELIAATLILYPRYIHPKTNAFCEVEVLLEEIDKERKRYNDNFIYKALIDSRNFLFRKAQFILKVLLGE